MKAEIISYTLEKAQPHQKTAIQRILYGYNDSSNKGEYHYQRKGLIDSLKGDKLNRGVFIIPSEHKTKVLSVLKKNKATVRSIPINL